MKERKAQIDLDRYATAAGVCACSNFRKASRAITQLFDQILQPSGLRSTQFIILLEIAVARSTTVPQLARQLVMDPSTVTRNLKPLAKRRLVKISGREWRSHTFTLSPRGLRVLEGGVPLWERAQIGFVNQLGQKRWRSLLSNLSAAVIVARGSVPSN
jgi:DNA-binding MarR family transcriptional regulator